MKIKINDNLKMIIATALTIFLLVIGFGAIFYSPAEEYLKNHLFIQLIWAVTLLASAVGSLLLIITAVTNTVHETSSILETRKKKIS